MLALSRKRKEDVRKFEELLKENEKYSDYERFIDELSLSLIEIRGKRNYENRIITLSEEQKSIIKNDIFKLSSSDESERKSMLIQGGPGTGKTVLLIASLLKIADVGKDVVLLTYLKTLDKFIKHLFKLYNRPVRKLGSEN